MGEKKQMY